MIVRITILFFWNFFSPSLTLEARLLSSSALAKCRRVVVELRTCRVGGWHRQHAWQCNQCLSGVDRDSTAQG